MIYRTYSSDSNEFDKLRETGMGYQVISAKLFLEKNIKFYVVYNSELIIELNSEFDVFKQRAFITKGIKLSLEQADLLNFDMKSITVLSKSATQELVKSLSLDAKLRRGDHKSIKFRSSGGKGAIDSPIESASGKEVFTRLSAFENDRRIDLEKKCLKDGSFSTTYLDYLDCVRFNDDPVDRYALPNDEEIKHVFYIVPEKVDKLQRGIVQPAFGKSGGGIETYFDKGTSENTYKGRKKYG